jgi:type IV pilus assembly protein PilB
LDDRLLIDALVAGGLISADQGAVILRDAIASAGRAEDVIYDRRLADEVAVARAKAKILGIPYTKPSLDVITPDLIKMIPEESVATYLAAPLSRQGDMLVVGMVHPDDVKAQEALRFIAKQNNVSLGVYLITPGDLEAIQRKYSPFGAAVQQAVKSVQGSAGRGAGDGPGPRTVRLEDAISVNEDAPVIKIVSSTLKEAVSSGASDIHIEPQRDRLRIRLRLDGILQEAATMPLTLHQPVVSRVKILANLKIDETRIPQDGRFRTVLFGRDIDYRVSTFPTPAGEKIAIRVLDPQTGLKKLDDLGLSGRNAEAVQVGMAKPFGMILISGPTGSGKTTTLYSLMRGLNGDGVNIVSLEDPVEYTIDGVNQSQVRPEIGYDFASGLREILRQDPDVIMVGEIRDAETAELATHAALTGHIVLSTLHTNNAAGVIPRLIDMGIDAFLLPAALNLMISQRLVGRLCDACKVEAVPAKDIAAIIAKELAGLREGPHKAWKSKGCPACRGKGIAGRIAIFEVLSMTRELADIVTGGPTENKVVEEAKRQGMLTLRQDGLLKAADGLISVEEVLRETSEG